MAQWNQGLPTLQQSLPGLQGARSGQDLMRAYLQNQQQQQQNAAQPGFNQAKMAQMLAQTQGQNIQNEQAPEILDIRKQGLSNALRNVKAKEEHTALQHQKMTSLMGNMLNRMSNNAAGKQFLSENPEFARNLLEGMQGVSQQFAQQAQQPIPGMGQPDMQPDMPQPQGSPGAIQQQMQTPAMQGQMPPPQPPASGITPGQVQRAQEATADRQVKDRTDMQTRNQKRFSLVLNNLVSKRPNLPSLFDKYVGANNKPKYLADLKSGSRDALDFRAFMKTDIPMIANELKRTMGGQSTDQETKLMEGIVNPDWWFGDGEQAKSQWSSFLEDHSLIERGLDVPLRDLFSQRGAAQPRESAPSRAPSSVSQAPSGTVEMVDEQGNSYAIPHSDVNAATQHGWRHANG